MKGLTHSTAASISQGGQTTRTMMLQECHSQKRIIIMTIDFRKVTCETFSFPVDKSLFTNKLPLCIDDMHSR